MSYRIRIDDNQIFVEDTIKLFEPITQLVMVRHVLPHGNPHYHIYVQCDIKEQSLRQRIKRRYPHLQPSDFSLKKCNPDRVNEYVQYMFNTKHGNVATFIDKFNFDDQLLADLMENAKKVSDAFAEYSEQKKRNKPTIYDLAMEVRQIFVDRYPNGYQLISDRTPYHEPPEGAYEYREYLEIGIDVCRKHKQPFEEHYLRRLITTAICEGPTGRRTIISKIMGKEFPDR